MQLPCNRSSMPRDMDAGMRQVLVLNASYEPLNITTWRRAMVMMIKGKAVSLEEDSSHKIRQGILLPTVIRLRQFVKVPYRELPLSRRNVLLRDNGSCQYCGISEEKLSVDHVIPRSRGGDHAWENVVTACLSCNILKGNKTPQEAGMPLKKQPRKPLSNLIFQTNKLINSGQHTEWRKYVIGW